LLRVFDYCGEHKIDLDGSIDEKMDYNDVRLDHKPEARLAPGGKKW
jgi:hypothetical protein